MEEEYHFQTGRVIHFKEKNPICVFPEMKLRGLVPNFYNHVSVYNLYFSQIQECGNYKTENYNSVFRTFIFSGNKLIGTRHLYWILTGPSFAVWLQWSRTPDTKSTKTDGKNMSSFIISLCFFYFPNQTSSCVPQVFSFKTFSYAKVFLHQASFSGWSVV